MYSKSLRTALLFDINYVPRVLLYFTTVLAVVAQIICNISFVGATEVHEALYKCLHRQPGPDM